MLQKSVWRISLWTFSGLLRGTSASASISMNSRWPDGAILADGAYSRNRRCRHLSVSPRKLFCTWKVSSKLHYRRNLQKWVRVDNSNDALQWSDVIARGTLSIQPLQLQLIQQLASKGYTVKNILPRYSRSWEKNNDSHSLALYLTYTLIASQNNIQTLINLMTKELARQSLPMLTVR